jgi:AmmeMemoRadiSam system protein B
MTAAIRPAAVAGRFYPGTAGEVARAVAQLYARATPGDAAAHAVMCPHAGWIYSGTLAAETLARVRVPARVVIVCPNHTGRGARVAVYAEGAWRLPGGDVPIDAALAARVIAEAGTVRGVRADTDAHAREHAIEVLVPLVRHRRADVAIVPIVVGQLAAAECAALGEAIARAIAADDVLVIASSDMNHYADEAETQAKDARALAALATGDPAQLLAVVDGEAISMCGARPAAVACGYARARGGAPPAIVGHTTSAAVSGDRSHVVGYAGAIWPR